MQEVDHQHRQRQAEALELTGRGEELLLRLVPQLALPEARGPVGELRGVPGGVGVVGQDVGVGVAGGDVVVHLAAAIGDPAGAVDAELGPAERGVVPQEPVAFTGDDEGHDGLHVPLVEVDHLTLEVEVVGGVLAHAVEAFAVFGGEVQLGLEEPLADGLEQPHVGVMGVDAVVDLAENRRFLVAAVAEELHVPAVGVNVAKADGDLAIS